MQTPDVVFPTSHVLLIKGGFQEKFARRQICPLYDLWRMKTEVIILKFVTLPENKVMKRCMKTGLGILLSILLLVLLNEPIYAQTDSTTKYWETFSMGFIGGLATGPKFVNNQDLGFWGFVDQNGIEKQIYGGYQWGISMAYRPMKYFDLFLNVLLARYKILMGKEGHQLFCPFMWNVLGPYNLSPPLPHDIYYISKVSLGQIGVRLIYPIEKSLEPYIGLGLNVGSYQIAFGNKNGSRAYSEILNGEKIARNLIFGVNFNIISQNKILLKISPYFEIGGLATEAGTEMHDWIWQGWTYETQFPIVPHYRFGIILGY